MSLSSRIRSDSDEQLLPVCNWWRPVKWPFEDKSHTVTLLEKIKWAMKYVTGNPDQTIKIRNTPRTKTDTIKILRVFGDEAQY